MDSACAEGVGGGGGAAGEAPARQGHIATAHLHQPGLGQAQRGEHRQFHPLSQLNSEKTSTGLYRSCAALTSFSGTFDLISFQAVNFEFIVKKVWFGLDRRCKQTAKINGLWCAFVCLI